MYVAAKGGEKAIENAHRQLAEARRGDPGVPELTVAQVREQMALAVDRVMTEGSLYEPDLAALAIKQARGDLVEAIFLLRAFRTTLPRFYTTRPLDTATMAIRRRISATFKDLPGGQVLGPTFDYTHRLLDFALADTERSTEEASLAPEPVEDTMPRVLDVLGAEGLVEPAEPRAAPIAVPLGPVAEAAAPTPEPAEAEVGDLTREPLELPAERDLRLQSLARGDEGFLLALGYSTQRGYGRTHPFAGEIRMGEVAVEIEPEELGFPVEIARVTVTECQTVNQFLGGRDAEDAPRFTRGYGLAFGQAERKAMAMALVDRALRARELNETLEGPAADEEFVLMHSDNVAASGFVEHLKLPHYVDFQSELELLRRLRSQAGQGDASADADPDPRGAETLVPPEAAE